jgi:uncharacterized protein
MPYRRARIGIRRWVRKILRQEDTPHSISLGVAVGVFWGFSPCYGLRTLLSLLTAFLARGNKVAAVLAVLINNVFTRAFVLYLQYRLGALFLPGGARARSLEGMKELARTVEDISPFDFRATFHVALESAAALGWEVLQPVLLGSVISAAVLGPAAYFLTRRAVRLYQRAREKRRRDRQPLPPPPGANFSA